MATIRKYRNKSGSVRHQAVVRVKGHPATSKSFVRRTDALQWAARHEADVRAGLAMPGREARRHLLADAIGRYIAGHMGGHARATVGKKSAMLAWWRDRLGSHRLDLVTPARIGEARDALVAAGIGPGAANNYIATLSCVFRVAVNEWQWITDNPCQRLRSLPEPPGRLRFLQPEALASLLDAARASSNPHLYPAVVLAVSTGMRRGELLQLTWADVDLPGATVRLRLTKNKEPRTVPLTPQAVIVLRELRAAPVRDIAGNVFPLGRTKLGHAFRRACAAAGITDFHWHDLRHTAASHLVMAGVPLRTVAEILGHRTLQMVMRYSHLSPEHLRQAIDGLGHALFGQGGNRV